jgi:hypothetical protein
VLTGKAFFLRMHVFPNQADLDVAAAGRLIQQQAMLMRLYVEALLADIQCGDR